MSTWYEKFNYDVQINIGSFTITTQNDKYNYGLCDDLIVSATTNQARTASFSFIPPQSTFVFENFQGQQVTIFVRKPNTGWEQLFSGQVDTPKLDFISGKITLDCTDNRNNRIIQLPPGVVQGVGSYSEAVFGSSKDQAEELEKRLQTIAGDFDFDRYGNYQLTPWLPKAIADYTFNSDNISMEFNPTVEYSNHTKTINTINIKITYTYQRLHHQCVNVTWAGYQRFIQDWWEAGKPNFPAKDTIISAASSGAWKVVSPNFINWTEIWPKQTLEYNGGYILWNPNLEETEVKARTRFSGYLKDSTGNFVTAGDPPRLVPQNEPVLDANGKQVYDIVKTTITDTSSHLCRGASWTAALRFAQSVTEEYTIKMKSPQAIAKYGIIDSYETVALSAPYDTRTWEGSDTINFVTYNFFLNQKTTYPELGKAIGVSLNKARHDILDLHRDVLVSFRTLKIEPQLDLKHTIALNLDRTAINSSASIQAKGKVYNIQHYISFKTSEYYTNVTLKLSRSTGSATNSPWNIPVPIEDPSYIFNTLRNIRLESHLGIDPDPEVTQGAEKWTGWVGNATKTDAANTTLRTEFPESFIVDYPAIPEILRENIVYYSDADLDLEIPNDPLTVSF